MSQKVFGNVFFLEEDLANNFIVVVLDFYFDCELDFLAEDEFPEEFSCFECIIVFFGTFLVGDAEIWGRNSIESTEFSFGDIGRRVDWSLENEAVAIDDGFNNSFFILNHLNWILIKSVFRAIYVALYLIY